MSTENAGHLVITDNLDEEHFAVTQHWDGGGRAVIVYYWADTYLRSPSDSWRMFWLGVRS